MAIVGSSVVVASSRERGVGLHGSLADQRARAFASGGESVTPAHLMAAALVVGGVVVLARTG